MEKSPVVRKTESIVAEFNATVRNLLNKFERKARSELDAANIDRLKKRIVLLKSTMGDHSLIELSSPFFIEYSDNILERNEDFFIGMDVRREYVSRSGNAITKNNEFIFSLIDYVRNNYNKSSPKEKDDLYESVRSLFSNSVEYNLSK
jgi:hypothetical protein